MQVCIDVAFMAQGYCDLASFSDLTSTTGGTLYQYTPFNPLTDHDQVCVCVRECVHVCIVTHN